jgi:hypothetical protein
VEQNANLEVVLEVFLSELWNLPTPVIRRKVIDAPYLALFRRVTTCITALALREASVTHGQETPPERRICNHKDAQFTCCFQNSI